MFSTSQFISLVLAPLAIVMLIYLLAPYVGAEAPRGARANGGLLSHTDARRRARSRRRSRPASGSIGFSPRVLPDHSRSQIQRLIKDGHVARRRPRRRKPNQPVQGRADRIAVDVPEPVDRDAGSPRRCRCRSSTRIATSIVVDKPAGMVVHPAAGHASGTLVNALLHHVDDLAASAARSGPASCTGSTTARRG